MISQFQNLHSLQVRITAVDIDPAMLEVATNYFDLVQDERLDVYIRDGAQFIQQAAEKGVGIPSTWFVLCSTLKTDPGSSLPNISVSFSLQLGFHSLNVMYCPLYC